MIAPTSVSSRFKARPMTPLPKSSISLSMASERPSILATPSPISRTVPTFWRVTPVFKPEIWASISCNNVLINLVEFSGALQQGREAPLHRAIINIAAHLHADAANQGGILRENKSQPRAVLPGQVVLNLPLLLWRQGGGALNGRGAACNFQPDQTLEMGKDGDVAARLGSDD